MAEQPQVAGENSQANLFDQPGGTFVFDSEKGQRQLKEEELPKQVKQQQKIKEQEKRERVTPYTIKQPSKEGSFFGEKRKRPVDSDIVTVLNRGGSSDEILAALDNINSKAFKDNNIKISDVPWADNYVKKGSRWIYEGVPKELIAHWKSKGPMGALESVQKADKMDMLPYVNVLSPLKDLPLAGIAKKIANGEPTTEEEKDKLTDYVMVQAERQVRGTSFGGNVAVGVAQMPAFVIEFLTGGKLLKSLTKKVFKETGEEIIERAVKKKIKGKIGQTIAKKAGKVLYEGIGRTAVLPVRAVGHIGDVAVDESIRITDKGQVILAEAKTSPAKAFFKGFVLQAIENGSEVTGEVILNPITKMFGGPIKGIMPKKLAKSFARFYESETGKRIAGSVKAMGWNGVVEELGEERIGDFMRTTFDLDEEQGYSLDQFGRAIFPGWEQLLVEGSVITFAGGGQFSVAYLADKLTKKGTSAKDAIEMATKMTALEREEIIKEVVAQESQEDIAEYEQIKQNYTKMLSEGVPVQQIDANMAILDAFVNVTAQKTGKKRADIFKDLPIVKRETIELTEPVFRETIGNANKDLYKMWEESESNRPEVVQQLSRRIYEGLEGNASTEQRAEIKTQVQNILENSRKEGQDIETAMSTVWSEVYGKASPELQQSIQRSMGLSQVSPQDTQALGQEARTQEFKKWFGDSKVVDENGEPLVVYHGSREGGFNIFAPTEGNRQSDAPENASFFTSSKEVAESYSGKKENIYETYLKMENPLEVDFQGASWQGDAYGKFEGYNDETGETNIFETKEEAISWLKKEGVDDIDNSLREDPWIGMSTNSITKEAIADGYDGVIIRNVIDTGGKTAIGDEVSDVYAVFQPNQIKDISNLKPTQDPNILKQGRQGAYRPDMNLIQLFKTADRSTFIHESAHAFMQYYLKNMPSELEPILKWSGINKTNLEDLTPTEYKRAQESFARGFEAYLMEGKAPNAELASTFEKFKNWLTDIYENIQNIFKAGNLNLELSDDVRNFFDQMLAAEDVEVEIDSTMKPTGLEGNVLYQNAMNTIAALKERMERIIGNFEAKQADIKDTVKRITKFINESPLPTELKTEFLQEVANAKTRKEISDLKKTIPYKAEVKVKELTRMEIKNKVKRALKKTKVTKQSGKIKGKYTPEIQKSLDLMREASKMTKAQATEKIMDNIEKYADDIAPPIEVANENSILLMMAGFEDMGLEELAGVLDTVTELKDKGRYVNQLKALARKTIIDEQKEEVLDALTGGEGIDANILKAKGVEGYKQKTFLSELDKRARSYGKTIVGWGDLLDMLSSKDKSSKAGESALNKIFDVLNETNAEKKGFAESNKKIQDMARDIYGFKNDSEFMDKFNNDKEKVPLEIKLKTGEAITLEISVAEARKRYMEFKDPTLKDTFEEMGYTEEIKKQIIDVLSPKDIAFADAQMKFYQEYYSSVNEIYKELYGVNLPMNIFYSPIAREGLGNLEDSKNEFLQEMATQRASVGGGAIKARVLNKHRLKQLDDVATMARHITDMEHFKAWAIKSRDMRAILGDPTITDAAQIFHDPSVMKHLKEHLESIISGGQEVRHRLGVIDKMRLGVIKAVLPLKLSITVKQLASAPAYANAIPWTEWVARSAKFWMHPIKNTRDLYKMSTLLKERGGSQERDLKAVAESKKYNQWRAASTVGDKLMMNVKFGDQAAIVMGGWAVYDYHKSQGKTDAEAIREFEKVTSTTQQSGDTAEQSYFQRGGSAAKSLTMFQSSQNQYFRKELEAVRGLYTGRMTKGQAAKQIAIYHVVLPTIFQFIANGFKWDDDEQKRAAILGSLNGVFLLGGGIEYVYNKLAGLWGGNINSPIATIFERFAKLGRKSNGIYDYFKILNEIVALSVKMPLAQIVNIGEGIKRIIEGDVSTGINQIYRAGNVYEKKSKKKGIKL